MTTAYERIFGAVDLDLATNKIVNVVDPSSAQDAATKHYVDGAISGAGSLPDPSGEPDGSWLRVSSGAAVWVPTPAVTEDDLDLSDVTTANASTSKHGFLKKLDNNSAHFMDGTGAWSTPSGGGTREIGYTPLTTSSPVTLTHATAVGTAITIVSAGALSFDGNPVVVEFYCPQIICPASSGNAFIGLFESTTNIAIMGLYATSSYNGAGHVRYRFTPSAGTHTYVVKGWNTGSTNDSTINYGAGGSNTQAPAFVRIAYA